MIHFLELSFSHLDALKYRKCFALSSKAVFIFAHFSNTTVPRTRFWGRVVKPVSLCFELLSELNTQLQQAFF